MPTGTYLRTLLPQLLNAGKSLSPRYWQERKCPTLQDWYDKTNKIQSLEYLRYSEGLEMEEYEEKWKDWLEFKCSIRSA